MHGRFFMLEKIKLANFQAHKSLVLELDALTTIVGPSDTGKSAILRALRWACLNDLAGDSFIKEGAAEVKVRLEWEEHFLTRSKGRHNTYVLDGKTFSSIAREVPEPISKLLHTSAINFQSQHDGPFWFCETASEVSRQLNAIVSLGVIDSSLSFAAMEVRQAEAGKAVSTERLAQLQKEYDNTNKQSKRVEDFKALKLAYEKFKFMQGRCSELAGLAERAHTYQNQARDAQEQAARLQDLVYAARALRSTSHQLDQLEELSNQILEAEKTSSPPVFDAVEDAYEDWRESVSQFQALAGHLENIEQASKEDYATRHELEVAEFEYQKMTKGKLCPICQRPLP